jgi:2-oxoacid:acceptor oxidoreductase gamma subunit (pyruvate/2-ketoisovalerate family)
MIEITFHGRGGQGVVVASEILARACFEEGLYPQSFSVFGGERRGAPVAAFVRVAQEKIYLKCDIDRADHLVLFDGALINEKEIHGQLKPRGLLLLNREAVCPAELVKTYRVGVVDALAFSKRHGLGAIVNTTVLGAYVRLTRIVGLETLLKVIRDTVPAAVDKNLAAAEEAYQTLFLSS